MEPIRDMFTAIFFVSVGMLIDPLVIKQFALPIIVITIVLILGKVSCCSIGMLLTGHESKTSLRVGLGLAQIGEFSFIIAQLGRDTEMTSPYLYPIAVSVSAITTISTPFLMNNADSIITQIKRFAPKPLVTFASLYPAWIAKIAQPEFSSRRKLLIYRDVTRQLPRLFFYLMCIIAGYFIGEQYAQNFAAHRNLYWTIVSVGVFPFFIGFAYALDKIFWEGVILNIVRSKDELSKAKETGEVLHNISRFFVILITGFLFILLASRLVPEIPWNITMVILVIASGVFLLQSVIPVHEKIERTIMGIFDHEKPLDCEKAKSIYDQMVELIKMNYLVFFQI
jgi:CPA2 family monovalent cation:H+ antiporter-2